MIIGILALQGDVQEHEAMLAAIGITSLQVRQRAQLDRCDALIIPGGESTTMVKLLRIGGLDEQIVSRVQAGMPVFGTCAGAILLASDVTGSNPPQPLGLMHMTIDRNAYGSQIDSFTASLSVDGLQSELRAEFIRAPIITAVESDVTVLSEHNGHPVIVRSGSCLAATCHPEVCGDPSLHQLFSDMI